MMHALAGTSLLLYVFFLLICVRALLRQSARLKPLAIALEVLGLLLQLGILVTLFWQADGRANRADLFYIIAAGLVFADLIIRIRYHYPMISFVLITMAVLCFVSSSYLMHLSSTVNFQSASYIYLLHVIPAALSILLQFFVMACAGAIIFFDRALKSKRASVLFLPNPGLARLGLWLRATLTLSFVAWTITVLSGAFYGLLRQVNFFSGDFVNSFSLLCWLLATLLFYQVLTRSGKIMGIARYSLLFSLLVALVFAGKSLILGNLVHSFVGL